MVETDSNKLQFYCSIPTIICQLKKSNRCQYKNGVKATNFTYILQMWYEYDLLK